MGININFQVKQCLVKSIKGKWAGKGIKYLGIILSKAYKDLVPDNLTPVDNNNWKTSMTLFSITVIMIWLDGNYKNENNASIM